MLFAIVMMMAEVPYVFFSRKAKGDEVSDSLRAVTDSLKKVTDSLMADSEYRQVADTLLALGEEAAAKLKRDTTTMDSIELAIYKHNKAVDSMTRWLLTVSIAVVRTVSTRLWNIRLMTL